MRLTTRNDGALILESREIRWMHLFVFMVLGFCIFSAGEIISGDSSLWWAGACLLAVLTWFGFARIASDTVVSIDTARSRFSFSTRSYFGGVDEGYACDLGEPFDVVFEAEGSTAFRVGFVTDEGVKYASRIFSGDLTRRDFETIQRHLGRESTRDGVGG